MILLDWFNKISSSSSDEAPWDQIISRINGADAALARPLLLSLPFGRDQRPDSNQDKSNIDESRASVVLPGCARPPRGGPGFFMDLGQIPSRSASCVVHDFHTDVALA